MSYVISNVRSVRSYFCDEDGLNIIGPSVVNPSHVCLGQNKFKCIHVY